MKLFVSVCVCLLLSACIGSRRAHVQAPVAAADHSHSQLVNVHSTLLRVKVCADPKSLSPELMNLFNQSAQAFNAASASWSDYQSALRIYGNSKRVLKRFDGQLRTAVDLGASLKERFDATMIIGGPCDTGKPMSTAPVPNPPTEGKP